MRLLRAVQVTAAASVVALVAAACGGGGTAPGVAALRSKSTETTTLGSAGPGSTHFQAQLLKYAACMRKNGVPNFPDPNAAGDFQLHEDPTSPPLEAAQAKCQKLGPVQPGGRLGLGVTTHPSARAMAQWLKVSQCMRRHGISEFPDPGSSVPSNPVGIRMIYDDDGVILLLPFTLNTLSPAFAQAATACHLGLSPAALGQGPGS